MKKIDGWPDKAKTVLVPGLYHSEVDLRLDYWELGDTWGNRCLREISEHLKQQLREKLDLAAYPLPYHVEKGGLFLKDAAVLSGIGIIAEAICCYIRSGAKDQTSFYSDCGRVRTYRYTQWVRPL